MNIYENTAKTKDSNYNILLIQQTYLHSHLPSPSWKSFAPPACRCVLLPTINIYEPVHRRMELFIIIVCRPSYGCTVIQRLVAPSGIQSENVSPSHPRFQLLYTEEYTADHTTLFINLSAVLTSTPIKKHKVTVEANINKWPVKKYKE